MRYKKLTLYIFCAALLFLIVFSVYRALNDEKPSIPDVNQGTPTEDIEKEEKTIYQNEKYNFGFEIPDEYQVVESSSEFISVGQSTNGNFKNLLNLEIVKADDEWNYQSFEEFVLDEVRISCAEKGTDYFTTCLQVQDLKPVETLLGVSGERFYLIAEKTYLASDTKVEELRGPYIVFNLSVANNNKPAFLMIHPPANISVDDVNQPLIGYILGSFSKK